MPVEDFGVCRRDLIYGRIFRQFKLFFKSGRREGVASDAVIDPAPCSRFHNVGLKINSKRCCLVLHFAVHAPRSKRGIPVDTQP
jgi:hypothetical protein